MTPTQQRLAAIVGIYEHPLRAVGPGITPLMMQVEAARKALEDAGLSWKDVDGLYHTRNGLQIAEYLGWRPTVVDDTSVGGSSFEFHAAHALRMIQAGKCKVAVLFDGWPSHSLGAQTGSQGFTEFEEWPPLRQNMEIPWGLTVVGYYALAKMRHMHQYGSKDEQFANVSVVTRAHAVRNPDAVRAMKDLGFGNTGEITIEDVLDSRVIADPLHLLECCMVSDGAGAVVMASPEVARNCRTKPVWVIGTGEAVKYRINDDDMTVSAGAQSAPMAFGEAGVRPEEIDVLTVYDSFTPNVIFSLEDLGFCKKGEGGAFAEGNRLRFDVARPALNTDGGGLSSNHPGMRGIYLLIEAARQLRGESYSQVKDARLAVAHGLGGRLGGYHSCGTIVLARD